MHAIVPPPSPAPAAAAQAPKKGDKDYDDSDLEFLKKKKVGRQWVLRGALLRAPPPPRCASLPTAVEPTAPPPCPAPWQAEEAALKKAKEALAGKGKKK